VADAAFTFTGPSETGYYQYTDLDAGSMLVAEPGGTYHIRAMEDFLPMPPDSRWEPAADPGPLPRAKAKAAAATDGTEGSGK
jgi:hypothetical protein